MITPGGDPLTEEEPPGLSPTPPLTVLEPVLVMAELPRTAKLVAVPSRGWLDARAVIGQAAPTNTATEIESNSAVRLFVAGMLIEHVCSGAGGVPDP